MVPAQAAAAANRLVDLRVRAQGERAVIEVVGSRPPSFSTFTRDGRLVIELDDAAWTAEPPGRGGAGPVLGVRGARNGAGARVTVELAPGAEAQLAAAGNTLRVEVAPGLAAAGAAGEDAARLAKIEAERKAREDAERVAKIEAERKAREEAERVAKIEAERKAREEAERVAKIEAERKAREEAERVAQIEAQRKAREDAERVAQLEAQRRAHEEAERVAQLEAQRRAHEEAERVAQIEAHRKAREEAERVAKVEAERKAREEAERVAQIEAQRKAHEEAERAARVQAGRVPRDEAARLAQREAGRAAAHPPAPHEGTHTAGDQRLARLDEQASLRGARLAGAEAPAAATSAARQDLVFLGFKPLPGGGARVLLRTAAAPAYRLEQAADRLVIVLERARIPRANDRRAIDASFFGTAVGLVRPVEDPRRDEVRVEIGLRTAAPRFTVQVHGDELAVDVFR